MVGPHYRTWTITTHGLTISQWNKWILTNSRQSCLCLQGVVSVGVCAEGSQEISLPQTIPRLAECLLLSVTCQMTTTQRRGGTPASELPHLQSHGDELRESNIITTRMLFRNSDAKDKCVFTIVVLGNNDTETAYYKSVLHFVLFQLLSCHKNQSCNTCGKYGWWNKTTMLK